MSGSAVLFAPKAALPPKKAPEVSIENGESDQDYHLVRKIKLTVDQKDGKCRVIEGVQIDPNYPATSPTYKTTANQLAQDGYTPVKVGQGKDAVTVFIQKSEPKDVFVNKDTTYHDVLNGGAGKKAAAQCALTLVGGKDPKTTGTAPKSEDTLPPPWLKDCVRVRIGQVISWYKIVPAKDGVKVTFKNDGGPDQETYLSEKDAADYYTRREKSKSGDAQGKPIDTMWMFFRKTKDGWKTTDKAPKI